MDYNQNLRFSTKGTQSRFSFRSDIKTRNMLRTRRVAALYLPDAESFFIRHDYAYTDISIAILFEHVLEIKKQITESETQRYYPLEYNLIWPNKYIHTSLRTLHLEDQTLRYRYAYKRRIWSAMLSCSFNIVTM